MKQITLFGCLAAVILLTSTASANSRMAHPGVAPPRARSTINRPAMMPRAMAHSPRMISRDQFRAGNFRTFNDRREDRFEARHPFFNDRREDRIEAFRHRRFRDRFIFVDTFFFDPFFFGFGFPFYAPYYYPYDYGYYNYSPSYGYSASIVVEVQTRLAHAGYYHGRIDGVMGRRTRAAIRVYERTHGLRVDGVISQQLIGT